MPGYDGIVLSGGSTSGLLMLGRLHMLMQQGRLRLEEIELFCGTSAGAIICLLLCLGLQPEQIATELAGGQAFDQLSKFNLRRTLRGEGILDQGVIEAEVRRVAGKSPVCLDLAGLEGSASGTGKATRELCMRDLRARFVCCSFNFDRRQVCYHDSLLQPDADPFAVVMASCAIPFLFRPALLSGECHVDGGIIDNFPLQQAAERGCRRILGVLVAKRFAQAPAQSKTAWANGDVLDLMFASSDNHTREQIHRVSGMSGVELDLHRLSSKIPFYSMQLGPGQVMSMFAAGMVEDPEQHCCVL